MTNVVFVAPFFLETTLRFVEAAASLPGVTFGLVSQDPESKLPPGLRGKLSGHFRVNDGLSAEALRPAIQAMRKTFGSVDRLLGTLEQLQVPLGQLRDELGMPGLGAEASLNFRDKARMKTVLSRRGTAVRPARPRHRRGRRSRGRARASGFPLVVKPPAGAGAHAHLPPRPRDGPRRLLALHAPHRSASRMLLEEFIVGEEHSFDSVVLGGRVVWHSINDYLPGSARGPARTPGSSGACSLPREVDDPRYDAIRRGRRPALGRSASDTGSAHMEWFRRPDGSVAISEVGARPPGAQFATLISYAHDFDFYRAWAELMVHDAFDPPPRPYAVGAAYLRGQGAGERVQAIHGLEEAQRELGRARRRGEAPEAGPASLGHLRGRGIRHPAPPRDRGRVEARRVARPDDLRRTRLTWSSEPMNVLMSQPGFPGRDAATSPAGSRRSARGSSASATSRPTPFPRMARESLVGLRPGALVRRTRSAIVREVADVHRRARRIDRVECLWEPGMMLAARLREHARRCPA